MTAMTAINANVTATANETVSYDYTETMTYAWFPGVAIARRRGWLQWPGGWRLAARRRRANPLPCVPRRRLAVVVSQTFSG